jgi:hypothetical protein
LQLQVQFIDPGDALLVQVPAAPSDVLHAAPGLAHLPVTQFTVQATTALTLPKTARTAMALMIIFFILV